MQAARAAPLEFHADRGLAVLVDQRRTPGLAVEQRGVHGIGGAAVVEVCGDQHAAGLKQLVQRLVQRRHRRVAVEKRNVVAPIQRRQHLGEITFVHGDALGKTRSRNVLARAPHMLGIALDGVDPRLGCAIREPERRVAERTAELEDAPRMDRSSNRAKQRTVVVGPSAAAMLGAMPERRVMHLGEWIVPTHRPTPSNVSSATCAANTTTARKSMTNTCPRSGTLTTSLTVPASITSSMPTGFA